MLHLLAVILTLFPGFGLGYLLLRRLKAFAISFLASLVLGSPILIGVLFEVPPVPAGMVFLIFPLVVFNFYMAHMLWLEPPTVEIEEEPQVSFDYSVAPWFATILAGLTIILIVVTITSQYWPDTKTSTTSDMTSEEREELRIAEVEEELDQHILSNKERLFDEENSRFYFQYNVEPGSYVIDLYWLPDASVPEVVRFADQVRLQTEYLVYAARGRVFVLHTSDANKLTQISVDLGDSLSGSCTDRRACGYAPYCSWHPADTGVGTYVCGDLTLDVYEESLRTAP